MQVKKRSLVLPEGHGTLFVHKHRQVKLLSSKDVVLSTVHETHSLVVSRRLAIRRVDIVSFSFYKKLETRQ